MGKQMCVITPQKHFPLDIMNTNCHRRFSKKMLNEIIKLYTYFYFALDNIRWIQYKTNFIRDLGISSHPFLTFFIQEIFFKM